MYLTDTHSHLYDPAFDDDRDACLERAAAAGVGRLLQPAIDSESHARLFDLCRREPGRCIPMMGLHPTSINDNPRWRDELALVEQYLRRPVEVETDLAHGAEARDPLGRATSSGSRSKPSAASACWPRSSGCPWPCTRATPGPR